MNPLDKFCSRCGASTQPLIPPGEDRLRRVCGACHVVHYDNPNIVVGSVAVWQDRVLMCKRAIEPGRGYWTLPAGFLEQGEYCEAGAQREAREEACTEIAIHGMLGIYSLAYMSQIQIIYAADMLSENFAPGVESLDVRLCDWQAIPWDDLAFLTVRWALEYAIETKLRRPLLPQRRAKLAP